VPDNWDGFTSIRGSTTSLYRVFTEWRSLVQNLHNKIGALQIKMRENYISSKR